MPRVLFSAPECRAIVIDLQTGEAMGNHHVRERAVVQVETPQGIRESAPGGTRPLQRRCRRSSEVALSAASVSDTPSVDTLERGGEWAGTCC